MLCDNLVAQDGQSIDLSLPLFRVVTNIICLICFNASYKDEDPALKIIHDYNKGIVNTLGDDNLVDIFPVLKVRMRLGHTPRAQPALRAVCISHASLQTHSFQTTSDAVTSTASDSF